jgi:enoyl-CoA hydratase/carnithine racemase
MNYTSKSPLLSVEIVDGYIAYITNNNPPANTWTIESLGALRDLVLEFNRDKKILALILTGNGEKFFSAGADLKMFTEGGKARAAQVAEIFGQSLETLANFEGISIAAINGYCLGGGLEAAMACDIRIAERHSIMGLPEAAVGLLPCGGGTQALAWLVGEPWAKKMILLGEKVDTERAKAIGLIEHIVEPGNHKQEALKLARQIAGQSPSSIRACKKLIQSARSKPMWTNLPEERAAFVRLFDTEDQKEGVEAFLQKRKPNWKNR